MNTDFTENFVRSPAKLTQKPALVLNADYRPLSYFPLSLWSWQDAVKAAYLDRVNMLLNTMILFIHHLLILKYLQL